MYALCIFWLIELNISVLVNVLFYMLSLLKAVNFS